MQSAENRMNAITRPYSSLTSKNGSSLRFEIFLRGASSDGTLHVSRQGHIEKLLSEWGHVHRTILTCQSVFDFISVISDIDIVTTDIYITFDVNIPRKKLCRCDWYWKSLNDQMFEISKLEVMMTLMHIVNKTTHRCIRVQDIRPIWRRFLVSFWLFPRVGKKQYRSTGTIIFVVFIFDSHCCPTAGVLIPFRSKVHLN